MEVRSKPDTYGVVAAEVVGIPDIHHTPQEMGHTQETWNVVEGVVEIRTSHVLHAVAEHLGVVVGTETTIDHTVLAAGNRGTSADDLA